MSSVLVNDVRRGFYLDSVALMRLSREIGALPGVEQAALMMGTPSNITILRDAGLLPVEMPAAQGNDLLIALRADGEAAARSALAAACEALDRPKTRTGEVAARHPRSLAAAVAELPGANLALVSVPGDFAAGEARKALRRGLHVMIFSDNVPLEDERSLKLEARDRGLLVMGPDCGTAVIAGAPLAFANRLGRGGIGIVGASGTGMQEVSCLVFEAGEGVSHAIGVGGRDLKPEIGGIMTLMAIDALDADPATRHVVVISKPPHPDVAATVMARIARSAKPFTVCFLGCGDLELPANATFARTLTDAAEAAIGRPIAAAPADRSPAPPAALTSARSGRIEGLFSGGTLCAEAQVILAGGGRRIVSNAAIPGVRSLPVADLDGHDRMIDLGADEYTRGRPHPMFDPAIREETMRAALADPAVAVVLVDMVIGCGAHADPAGHLAGTLAGRAAGGPVIVGSVTGTEQDRQVRSRQIERLREAGILVAASNARASELALAIATAGG